VPVTPIAGARSVLRGPRGITLQDFAVAELGGLTEVRLVGVGGVPIGTRLGEFWCRKNLWMGIISGSLALFDELPPFCHGHSRAFEVLYNTKSMSVSNFGLPDSGLLPHLRSNQEESLTFVRAKRNLILSSETILDVASSWVIKGERGDGGQSVCHKLCLANRTITGVWKDMVTSQEVTRPVFCFVAVG